MNFFRGLLLGVVLLSGCSVDRYQNDVANNRYGAIRPFADPRAAYVGEWTGQSSVGTRSIKIREDGFMKICLSPSSGTAEGKVFLEDGAPAFMVQTGAKIRILEMTRDHLLLDVYGSEERYHAGMVDEFCAPAFKNFD